MTNQEKRSEKARLLVLEIQRVGSGTGASLLEHTCQALFVDTAACAYVVYTCLCVAVHCVSRNMCVCSSGLSSPLTLFLSERNHPEKFVWHRALPCLISVNPQRHARTNCLSLSRRRAETHTDTKAAPKWSRIKEQRVLQRDGAEQVNLYSAKKH